jgi:hypothetical protein
MTSVQIGTRHFSCEQLAAHVTNRGPLYISMAGGEVYSLLSLIEGTTDYVAFDPNTACVCIINPFTGEVKQLTYESWGGRRMVSRNRLTAQEIVQAVRSLDDDQIDKAALQIAEAVHATGMNGLSAIDQPLYYTLLKSTLPERGELSEALMPADMLESDDPIRATAAAVAAIARAGLAVSTSY